MNPIMNPTMAKLTHSSENCPSGTNPLKKLTRLAGRLKSPVIFASVERAS